MRVVSVNNFLKGVLPPSNGLQVDVFRAWQVYQDFEDKNWSFTDCVSRVVMERLGIQTAFALDDDFRQFGTVVVVPNRP